MLIMANKSIREPSPELHARMSRIAPDHFEFDRLSRGRHVVFDRSGFTEFNVSVANSPEHSPALKAAMKRGDLQVVNHDYVEQLSHTHSRFHGLLHDAGIRVPPTVIQVSGKRFFIGKKLPVESTLWVKKVSFDKEGRFLGHRGAGVSIFVPKKQDEVLPTHDHEFYQQFIVPPDDYLKDIRVYVVGNKIIPGYVRTAKKPLTRANYSGLYPPNEDQFVTAEHPGKVTLLEGELAQKVVAEAEKVRKAFIERLRIPKSEWNKQPMFGFGSMDFLLDANGEPVICEFDTSPEIRDIGGLRDKLANEMADHLAKQAGTSGTVHIVGDKRNDFIAKVLVHLKKRLDKSRISHKQPLHQVALGV